MTKVDLLKHMYDWNSDIIELMRNTNHNVDSKNLNEYHLEGDVWSHTMLTFFNSFDKCEFNNDIKFVFQLAKPICALFHDIGKPECRFVKNEKVVFYGHESLSISYAVDFLYYLNNIYKWDQNDFLRLVETVTFSICHHLNIYNIQGLIS